MLRFLHIVSLDGGRAEERRVQITNPPAGKKESGKGGVHRGKADPAVASGAVGPGLAAFRSGTGNRSATSGKDESVAGQQGGKSRGSSHYSRNRVTGQGPCAGAILHVVTRKKKKEES